MKRFLLLGMLAAGLSFGQPAPVRGGDLRLAIQAEPRTFDPHLAADEPSEIVRYLTTGTLARLNRKTQEAEPDVAVSWKTSRDGRRVRFELRPNIRFADGRKVTPADVCFTMARITDPKRDAPNGESLRSVAGSVRCQPMSSTAVELSFDKPVPSPERWMDGVSLVPANSDAPFPALGPFLLKEHKAGVYVLLARNPNYWKRDAQGRALPYLDTIRLEIQRNRDLELMRFRRGEFHLIHNLEPELYQRLRTEQPAAVHDAGVSLDSEQVWFNLNPASPIAAQKKQWFQSRGFRQAVSAAIAREDMVRLVYHGYASPAGGAVSPANLAWHDAAVKPSKADPNRARALLRAEGYRLENGVLKDRQGHPVAFSLITNAGNKSRERMALMMVEDLARVGIKVSFTPLDFPSLIQRITASFDYDACLLGLVNSDLDPNAMLNVWLSSGPNHQWNPGQKSPATPWEAEMDRLMLAQAKATDSAARKKMFDRVQEILADELPFIYLVNRHALTASRAEVGNADPVVLRPQLLWNAERLYLRTAGQR
jgi:peptide/nickel transport system substrate-binding protein